MFEAGERYSGGSREYRWGLRQVRDCLAYLESTGKGLKLVRDNLADIESTYRWVLEADER